MPRHDGTPDKTSDLGQAGQPRLNNKLSGRRDGPVLQVAGSVPVAFSGWHIKGPASYGFAASLASHGVAEMLLILHRR